MEKRIENITMDQERALYGVADTEVANCCFDGPADGESALKECDRILVRDSYFNLRYPFWHDRGLDTKDAFWHAENVVVRNSTVKGEYLAWYCENVTFENCRIIGTQPLCYCKDLKLVNCQMEQTDLALERSEVEATVTTPVLSIKNPYKGHITVPEVGEIILDDPAARCKITVTG